MTGRTAFISFLVLIAATGEARTEDAPPGRVTATAEPPVVTVTGLPPGRYFVDLPALAYAFEITADCGGDAVPQSVSINVADSRITLNREELAQSPGPPRVLTIPASQTAPVAVDDFCTLAPGPAEATPAGPQELSFTPSIAAEGPQILVIPDVLSAQVSLVCGEGEERRMSWASQPLAVTLACALPLPVPASPGGETAPEP